MIVPSGARLARLGLLVRRAEELLLALTLGAMMLLAGSQIALRNLWESGLGWSDPLLRVLVLWLGMLGALAATGEGRHIRIDLLTRFLPPRGRELTGRLGDLFSAAVCALLAWHGGRLVAMEYANETTAFAQVPAWLCEAIIPLGFGLMALRFLIGAVTGTPLETPDRHMREEAQ